MFGLFKKGRKDEKKGDKEDIVVLKKTEKGMCGGTDATLDRNAPKKVESDDILSFEAFSALNTYGVPAENEEDPLGYVYAFAAPCGGGTFLSLGISGGFRRREGKDFSVALINKNVLPDLASLIRECDLAKNNGFHSKTHGLPENFGGSVRVIYATGEKISFSNNQSPIISYETGVIIKDFFKKAMSLEKIVLPDVTGLRKIKFYEQHTSGGYTKAVLTINDDGSGSNAKESRYDGPEVYNSEKDVDPGTVKAIIDNIERTLILGWADLPDNEYDPGRKKELTFVFSDGKEIKVGGNKKVPSHISRGFFNIELEMTTKH